MMQVALEGVANAENQIQTLEGELDAEIERQVLEIIASKLENAQLSVSILQERIAKLGPEILETRTQIQDINRIQVERDSLNRRLRNEEERAARATERLADIAIIDAGRVIVIQLTPPAINQP